MKDELIIQLTSYDNEKGYKLDYKVIEEKLNPVISKIVHTNDKYIDNLHKLITHSDTWSSLFALKALKEIKSQQSIPHLIKFILDNENSEYFENCEEAMFALTAIGNHAIDHLISEIQILFSNKHYLFYLVGALTEIKSKKVYYFMKDIVKDYIDHIDKYAGWFHIDHFTFDFDVQGNSEIISLLKMLLEISQVSKQEKREIEDTIHKIDDPEGYESEINELVDSPKKRKLGRNEPCYCGSGKKYKRCCLEKDLKEIGRARKI